jgi:GTPase SAR1 family protein
VARTPQPARKSYFFGKGYRDLGNTIKGAWSRNLAAVGFHARHIAEARYGGGGAVVLFKVIFNIVGLLSVLLFGTVITCVMTLLNIVILLVFMLVVYLGFTLVWTIDHIYLLRKRIFTACHDCKEKALIPTYICPKCGEKHTVLTPGVYGILKRTCRCGEKMPTTFFTKVQGRQRRDYEAVCPNCQHPLADRETVPICIPVVGGRSVGKTAFITAFSHDFIEQTAPAKGWEIAAYNAAKQQIYNEIVKDYQAGSTRMTDRPQDVQRASSVSFSFFVKGPAFKPERLVHIYDIAGEVFTDNNENEMQKQYEYCQGIVLIIDPFAIPSVYYRCEGKLAPADIAGIGTADINGIIDSFLNKLREVTGLSNRKMSSVPLAVVISKNDSAGLSAEFGPAAVKALAASDPVKYSNEQDVQDYLCRKFLQDNGMEAFLNNICIKFKNNRFFACSAIGHTRGEGAYEPRGVMAPMEWLFRNADVKMAKLWADTPFTNKPLAAAMQAEP